jgi:hypothetical protein
VIDAEGSILPVTNLRNMDADRAKEPRDFAPQPNMRNPPLQLLPVAVAK